jgi:hypothetical protein
MIEVSVTTSEDNIISSKNEESVAVPKKIFTISCK